MRNMAKFTIKSKKLLTIKGLYDKNNQSTIPLEMTLILGEKEVVIKEA
jgi:hypothetical protein